MGKKKKKGHVKLWYRHMRILSLTQMISGKKKSFSDICQTLVSRNYNTDQLCVRSSVQSKQSADTKRVLY